MGTRPVFQQLQGIRESDQTSSQQAVRAGSHSFGGVTCRGRSAARCTPTQCHDAKQGVRQQPEKHTAQIQSRRAFLSTGGCTHPQRSVLAQPRLPPNSPCEPDVLVMPLAELLQPVHVNEMLPGRTPQENNWNVRPARGSICWSRDISRVGGKRSKAILLFQSTQTACSPGILKCSAMCWRG